MTVLFSNNASATLASSISTFATSITVSTGQGALFPSPTGGAYFFATLTDSSNTLEIIKVTARTADVLTVVRAQEGTTSHTYAAGDKVELRVTAAALSSFAQLTADQTFSGANTFSGATSLSAPTITGVSTAPTASYGTNTTQLATTAFVQAALQALYPVGSIYSSTVSTNPGTLFGFGTWVAYAAGRVLLGTDGSTYTAGATGGSADAITVAHTHTASLTGTAATGGTHTHTYKTYGLGNTGVIGNAYTNYDWGFVQTGNPTGTAEGAHSHTVSTSGTTDSTGSSGTNANLQPYVVVYMWTRTV